MKTAPESEFQCAAESIRAGAIRDRVDILTAPNNETYTGLKQCPIHWSMCPHILSVTSWPAKWAQETADL